MDGQTKSIMVFLILANSETFIKFKAPSYVLFLCGVNMIFVHMQTITTCQKNELVYVIKLGLLDFPWKWRIIL